MLSGSTLHFSRTGVEYARAGGSPSPELTVPLSGAAMVVGALMVAVGLWADVGALILIAVLIPITYFMHAFWKLTDPQEKAAQQAHFLKNMALIGGAVIVFWAYNQGQDLPASLTDALLDPW